MSTEIPPKASSPSSAQDTQQALPCNTHTATQSKTIQSLSPQIPPLPLETTTKIMQPWPLLPDWRLCLSQQKLQRLQPVMSPGEAVPAAISQHLLHCFSAEREWLLLPGTHGSLSRRVLYSAQFSSKVSACGGELPALGAGGFWLQWLLTLSIASGVC